MPTQTQERDPAGTHEHSPAAGKAARARVPLEAHGEFEPPPGRDPVGLLAEQSRSRIPELVPVRHGRMLVSPFTYSAPIEQMDPTAMATYGALCGWTLARAHARTGDRAAIAAYLGRSPRFEQAVTDFAVTYADQTERDHAALAQAVASGRLQARTGV